MVDLQLKSHISAGLRDRRFYDSRDTSGFAAEDTIVWAIDVFSESFEFHEKTALTLKGLFPHAVIHPVYVLAEKWFSDRGFSNFLRPALKPMAFKAVTRLLTEFDGLRFKKPRILVEIKNSRWACARKLVRYSEKIGAGLISLGSHGHGNVARLIGRSFSEVVLDVSRIPTMLNGPVCNPPLCRPKHIVFPTDFSEECEAAFERIVRLSRQLDAELHLFYKSSHLVDPIVQSGVNLLGGGWVSLETYFHPIADDHDDEAKDWIEHAQNLGVTTHYVAQNFREPTSDAIVQYVQRLDSPNEPALLAMVSRAGPFSSAFLGSITRDVIRKATCPVFVAPRSHAV